MLSKCEGCAYCYENIHGELRCVKDHICDWDGCADYEAIFDENEEAAHNDKQ